MSRFKLLLLVACAVLAACTPAGPTKSESGELPAEWQAYATPGQVFHYVFPIVMPDGTRCVVAAGSYGRSITCDWSKQ